MVASFDFLAGAEPYISTRIKMGQTSLVRVVVKAGGKTYNASKEVKSYYRRLWRLISIGSMLVIICLMI